MTFLLHDAVVNPVDGGHRLLVVEPFGLLSKGVQRASARAALYDDDRTGRSEADHILRCRGLCLIPHAATNANMQPSSIGLQLRQGAYVMSDTVDHGLLYRKIVEDSPLAILYADREGLIRFWNSGAEEMFGYRADEMLGKSMDPIIPENLRPRHWDGWNKTMATGVTRYGRDVLSVPAMRKDGSRISVEFYIILLRAPTGEVAGAAAMMQDVTKRWQQQKEMRARLAALEAAEKSRTGG